MPAPWILAAGAALIGAAIAGSRNSSSNDSDHYDDEQEVRKRAEEERKKAQKKAEKQLLRKQFDARLSKTQEMIQNNVAPYFSMKFNGHSCIKENINENNQFNSVLGIPMQKAEMKPLCQTVANLNYLTKVYDVEITPDIELHHALQAIEGYTLALQEAQQLKRTILQTAIKLKRDK